uniref:DNA polymerase kappa n=1 Tax=Gouania willdenowi TaxID=441366 RepID=A0A8C5I6X7_GOUWI
MQQDRKSEKESLEGFLSRMALNDNKAGMEGLDRDKINKIIMETSKGSRFYENELKRELQVNQRIEKMMLQKAQITEQQLKKAQAEVERMAASMEKSRDLSRVIVHVDMDAFYAAVEMRDCPELKDKPMAVGSMSMLSTSNYHARKFGVRAAMPGFIAKKLCPDLIIVPTNFDKYRAVSNEIREIFALYDPHFQPLSLDEAFLDFTDHIEQRKSWPESLRTHHYHIIKGKPPKMNQWYLSPVLFEDSPVSSPSLPCSGAAAGAVEVFGTSVEEAVREMRFRIEQKTMLTASAGIAPNMMLAKVCSDKNKPNGQYVLPSTREAVMDFIQTLPVRKIFGIGKVSEKMLNALGVSNCSHLSQQMALLSLLFSDTSWHHFMEVSLGLGHTFIPRHEERKSMSTERTFKEMNQTDQQLALCKTLCQDLAGDMKKEGLQAKTVTLKLKNVNFEVKTRAQTLLYAISTEEEIFAAAKELLKTEIENESPQPLRLRLMGVRVSAFVTCDDKKPTQRSIIGFLQASKNECSSSNQRAHQNSEKQQKEPQQSFFQRAHALRLQLQTESSKSQEEANGETAPTSVSSGVLTSKEESETADPRKDDDFINPTQVHASTSGCEEQKAETLTCPVCFQPVETTDLNIFNRHIDACLHGRPDKPNRSMIVDSDSDEDDVENHLMVPISNVRGKCEVEKEGEESWLNRIPPQKDQFQSVQKVFLISEEKKPSQQTGSCNSKSPALICPVCQCSQETDDLNVFNHHVDLCLNQEVLLELRRPTIPSARNTNNSSKQASNYTY